ncbi:DNA-dependent metalloprotease SPRTN-like isoform X2 [Mya arenaria]|uniref:DNA-dependent metalloprotease SPRTN-like isoform X2 n=1 Tax=Mya arenaria TaxID=6604 RepID=UPI0022E5BE22|nr:DNA-dependent metalloprotease SPRTN-like isoform X2 [Mya arenaria]
MGDDYALALQLQSDFFAEHQDFPNPSDKNGNSQEPTSLVDPYWEMTDPNPDIRALFLQFNERFFWGQLSGIEVKWSPRMTLCAGLCCYEGRGGLCSVRLSVPLLKLRPRKDLVETLLHEMIHAYLFVTDNNKDHDGHGPEFHKHMYRINKETGTNISVYHNFHDEVDACRQHWWRCDGPCRERKPYFGYVKRSMNRAPSKNDTWWGQHQSTCGGTYTKVKEPEGYGKKKGKKDKDGGKKEKEKSEKEKSKDKNMDIRIFGGTGKSLGGSNSSIGKPTSTISKLSDFENLDNSSTSFSVHSSGGSQMSVKDSRHSSSDSSSQFLPGSKTPGKSNAPKNKPVSQGGTASFSGAGVKKKVIDFDWSDSEDDEFLLTLSKSMEEKYNKSSESRKDLSVFSDDSDIEAICTGNDSISSQGANLASNNGKFSTGSGENMDSAEVHIPGSKKDEISVENDHNDVRAMLRKVWGAKQFKSHKTPLSSGSALLKINTAKPVKRLSDHEGDSVMIKKPKLNESHGVFGGERTSTSRSSGVCNSKNNNIQNSSQAKAVVTSPISKMFNLVRETKSDSNNGRNQSVERCNQSDLTPSAASSGASNVANTDNVEMSSCPVCCKMVKTTSINEHLDLCLTEQAMSN